MRPTVVLACAASRFGGPPETPGTLRGRSLIVHGQAGPDSRQSPRRTFTAGPEIVQSESGDNPGTI